MAAWSSCIVPNRTLKSVLWEQFGSPSSDDRTVAKRNVAICRVCKVELLFKNNTTNIFTLLECHHKDVHSSSKSTFIKYSKQSTLHESINALQPLSTSLLLIIIHFHFTIWQYIASILCTISNTQILPYCYSSCLNSYS